MINKHGIWWLVGIVLILHGVSCAGANRSCASSFAGAAGANWIVVQYDLTGIPIMCWELRSTSIANESQSDGIYWQDAAGNIIHISGLYNRVMVRNDKWDEAYRLIGTTRERCAEAARERFSWLNEQYGDESDIANTPPHNL